MCRVIIDAHTCRASVVYGHRPLVDESAIKGNRSLARRGTSVGLHCRESAPQPALSIASATREGTGQRQLEAAAANDTVAGSLARTCPVGPPRIDPEPPKMVNDHVRDCFT